jgi:hypothetical protein
VNLPRARHWQQNHFSSNWMTGSGIVESLGVVGRVSVVMEIGGWKPDVKTASRTLIGEL